MKGYLHAKNSGAEQTPSLRGIAGGRLFGPFRGEHLMRQSPDIKRQGFTIVELLIVVVVIAILAAITILSYNGITQQAKEVDMKSTLAQWKKRSELHKIQHDIECPENYVFIYGSSTLGTNDFCVMKYEAKNVDGVATSQAADLPWISISQTSAIAAAAATGGHLITEAEWMTIAADVLSVKYNWSGGEVGSGHIFQGNVRSNYHLAASTDDSDNLSGLYGIGINPGDSSSRVLYLSSGEAIWDFSGNTYEWTQQAISTPAFAVSQIGDPDKGWTHVDWTLGSSLGNLPAYSRPSALTSYTNQITSVTLSDVSSWDSTKGVGKVYSNYASSGSRAFYRGGSSNDNVSAGVLALGLNISPSTSAAVGFRVAR